MTIRVQWASVAAVACALACAGAQAAADADAAAPASAGTSRETTVVTSAPAMAGRAPEPSGYLYRGRTEYGLLGNLQLSSPASQTLTLRYAPMVDRHLQWGLDFSYTGDGSSNGFIGALGNYYFGEGRGGTYPYAGIAAGTTYGDRSEGSYGVQGGLKHFLTPHVAVSGELQYRRMAGMDWSGFMLGLSYYTGGPNILSSYSLPTKNTREFDLFGDADFDAEEEIFGFSYGPFIDPRWQWGGQFQLEHVTNATSGTIGGFVNYHIPLQSGNRLLPYVGFDLGTTWGDAPNVFSYGPHGGIKYFLTKDVAFKAQLNYQVGELSGATTHRTNLQFGFGYFY